MVVEGEVPNSLESVGKTTLIILASNTDMINAREAATTAQILRGFGKPSVVSVIVKFFEIIAVNLYCKNN